MTPRVVVAVLVALGAAVVAAAPQVTFIRDPGSAPQTGTGVIIGTVTTDESTPQPVRRATVTLNGGGLRTQRQTVTDNSGRYALTELPSGTFSLSTSKPSFVSLNYGATQPGQGGTPIVLAAGQQSTAHLKLMRGGVISGTVLDQYGRPRSSIRIQVMQSRIMGGQRRWMGAGTSATGSTDDRGAYRVYGLAPGNYVVAAIQQNIQDVRLVTADEVRWVQQEPPSNVVGGASSASAPPPQPGPAVSYAPVYYPGAPDLASATSITIGPGEERGGLDFQMQPVPAAKLEGVVTDPEGRPAQQPQVSILTDERLTTQLPFGVPSSVRIDQATGKFTITGVTPGRYLLTARSTIRPPAPPSAPPPPPPGGRADAPGAPGRAGGAPTPPTPPPSPITLWAMAQIDVSGRDIANISLALQPGLSISGRLVFEASALPAPADLTRVRVNLSSSEPGPFNTGAPGVTARADGTFTLSGVLPGRYRLSPSAPSAPGPQGGPWVVKSILFNGREVIDSGLDIGGESLTGLVVTFTDRVAELTGSLVDAAGAPTRNLSVMLFTTDRTFWAPQSRRVRTTMPGQDGKFRFASMPPGEYYLVAVTDADQIDLTDVPGLEQIAAAALKITLAEGEKKQQDLKVAK